MFNKNNQTNSFFLGNIGFAGFYFGRKIYLKRKLRAYKLDNDNKIMDQEKNEIVFYIVQEQVYHLDLIHYLF